MKTQKKLARLNIINQLLSNLNDSILENNNELKNCVRQAYSTINQDDSINKRYKEVPDAINDLNSQLQHIALTKKHHFSPEQDKLISDLTTFTNKMFAHGWYGLIYMGGIGQ